MSLASETYTRAESEGSPAVPCATKHSHMADELPFFKQIIGILQTSWPEPSVSVLQIRGLMLVDSSRCSYAPFIRHFQSQNGAKGAKHKHPSAPNECKSGADDRNSDASGGNNAEAKHSQKPSLGMGLAWKRGFKRTQ
jgi:hypothetical protein